MCENDHVRFVNMPKTSECSHLGDDGVALLPRGVRITIRDEGGEPHTVTQLPEAVQESRRRCDLRRARRSNHFVPVLDTGCNTIR
jgi:hypothetical protein